MSLADLATMHEGFGGASLMQLLASFPVNTYVFRGQPDESWSLQPSIERLPELMLIKPDQAEDLVLRAFIRRAHHYLQDLPHHTDRLEWLALMRHYGAPTRLLDWTASPYIAAFFAAAEARQDVVPVIWAVHATTLLSQAALMLHETYPDNAAFDVPASFAAYPRGDHLFRLTQSVKEPAVVVPVRPFRFNDRLVRQQGWFLCANSLSISFESILKQMIQRVPKTPHSISPLIGIKLTREHGMTLLELAKMNITYETLFPGLDGFARSLETHLRIRTVAGTSNPEDWL
jgi:hypothetical protein